MFLDNLRGQVIDEEIKAANIGNMAEHADEHFDEAYLIARPSKKGPARSKVNRGTPLKLLSHLGVWRKRRTRVPQEHVERFVRVRAPPS